jgi:hypothetical protein
MNPFFEFNESGYYTGFVRRQIKEMKVGDSKKVDIGSKDVSSFRMTLRYISSGNLKFKTKTDANGDLWVMRIA